MAETDRRRMRLIWKTHKLIWRLSGGRFGRRLIGMPVLELVTIGHKSGQERQILMTYVDSDGSPAIIATNAGRDTDPAWVKNLRANPQARARWNGEWHDVSAVELSGAAYSHAWETVVAAHSAYAKYKKTLTRPIPIMRLEPR